jgi:hypothetical protein
MAGRFCASRFYGWDRSPFIVRSVDPAWLTWRFVETRFARGEVFAATLPGCATMLLIGAAGIAVK